MRRTDALLSKYGSSQLMRNIKLLLSLLLQLLYNVSFINYLMFDQLFLY